MTPANQHPIRKIIQLELNEVSRTILDPLVKSGKLPHFSQMLREFDYRTTLSENKYEHLEPWIQWVTAHTGKTFAEHQIFRLGDAHQLQHKQIWEILSDHNLESAIIGSMNVTRGQTKGGIFFPDPWSIESKAYPEKLQPLWNFISKGVNGHAAGERKFIDLVNGLLSSLEMKIDPVLLARVAFQIARQKVEPKSKWRLAALFDEFLAQIFLNVLRSTHFSFYTLFLNSIAHFQHHFWRNHQPELFDQKIRPPDCLERDDPITHGLMCYDRILGSIFAEVANDPSALVIVATGLSQEPYLKSESQGGMNYYRLRNHNHFVSLIGLREESVFPLMSRDWQYGYADESDRIKARKILESLQLNGEPLFKIAENTPGFLFVETSVTRAVQPHEMIQANQTPIGKFAELFVRTAVKSGSHITKGHLWVSRTGVLPGHANSEIPLTDLPQIPLLAFGLSQVQSTNLIP